jgi:hypothetical protein
VAPIRPQARWLLGLPWRQMAAGRADLHQRHDPPEVPADRRRRHVQAFGNALLRAPVPAQLTEQLEDFPPPQPRAQPPLGMPRECRAVEGPRQVHQG